MNEKFIKNTTLITTSVIGVVFLAWWMLHDPVSNFEVHIPGSDNRPEILSTDIAAVNIGEIFEKYETGTPLISSSNWPRFRGENFDNISRANTKLLANWNKKGPKVLWKIDLGEGHAGPVIADGRVYLTDYDEIKKQEILRCFSFRDGKEIWRRGYDLEIKRNHGMSRTVPAVWDNYVLSMGSKCQVMCVSADSGSYRWGIDLLQAYQTKVPLWYTGQCPLIDDSTAVIAVGGTVLLIGVNLQSGAVVWETPNPMQWQMSHSSIMPMTIEGTKMYVYCALGGIVGVSAEKNNAGELLFQSSEWNQSVVAPSPVYLGDGKIYLTAGYGAGCIVIRVKKKNQKFDVEVLQRFKPDEGLAAEQQTPIFYKGHLYAIMPKDAGALRNQFVCVHPDDCSKPVWSSGKTKRFGLGPFLMADNKFFILSDEGVMTVINASIKEYQQIAEAKILDGHDAWGPLAIADGKMLARDSRHMVCVDIRDN
jgi:outer membrane protein assembly factor BamB